MAAVARGNVYSCSGFVRASLPLDFSNIKVKLLTPEGHLKHEEAVNVANGYYIIPVYSKGHYSLRVVAPDGWFFEPQSFDFKLDGKTDKCTLEEDINFNLVGFDIQGAVESSAGQGPSGLKLSLLKEGDLIASTVTTENGRYRFQAPPGEYTVTTGEDSSVCISHSKSTVSVKNGPVQVTPALRISGYPLDVSISSGGADGVEFLLFAAFDPKLRGCRAVSPSDAAPHASTTICSLGKTSGKDELRVPCIPPGKYTIRPAKDGLFFEPGVASVEVVAERVKQSFLVSGFTASGRVTVDGKAVPAVQLIVNGKETEKTDSDGRFTLGPLGRSTVRVTAKADHSVFSTVEATLDFTHRVIPDIVVEGFEMCGKVEKSGDGLVETLAVSSSSLQKSIRPDGEGNFCVTLPPGIYTLGPAKAESSLSPRKVEVDVRKGPSLSHSFTHFKTDLEAVFTCIGTCEPLTVSLVSSSGVSMSSARGIDNVLFTGVSPGRYSVRVPEGGRYCWEQRELQVLVEQAKPAPLHFSQIGFNARITLSHPASIEWSHAEEKALHGKVDGVQGLNEMCLPTAGTYSVRLSSCFSLDHSSLSVTVPSDSDFESTAIAARIEGVITGVKGAAPVRMTIRCGEEEKEVTVGSDGVFSFFHPLTSAGESIVLTPHSETHLFDPSSRTVSFTGECVKLEPSFAGTKGIFIDGSVHPVVPDVVITATHKKDKNAVLRAKTDQAGKYRVGPVRAADDLLITADKDGYSFTATNIHGNFKSVKLSQLTLTFEDSVTGERLDDVSLYVRTPNGEKSQHRVGTEGVIRLAALAPDTFIRAIMQEYEFDPSTITVTMGEGVHEEKRMKAKRVAYSVFGGVHEMSGAPVSDVLVEALSEQCEQHHSETTTSASGSFRVRGLRPGCTYKVSLRAEEDGGSPPHCFPSSFQVKMTAEDVKGLKMVAAPVDDAVELFVEVDSGDGVTVQRPATLKVTLLRDSNGDVVSTQTLQSPVSMLVARSLPRDGASYTVRVEAPSSALLHYAPAEASFIADRAVKIVTLAIAPYKTAQEVEISKGCIVALFLFALIGLFILNPQEFIDKGQMLWEKAEQMRSGSVVPSEGSATAKKRK